MISTSDRTEAIALIDEAVSNGAKLTNACKILNLTEHTYYRCKKQMKINRTTTDLRPTAKRPTPANKLTETERAQIIEVVNQKNMQAYRLLKLFQHLQMKASILLQNQVSIVY